MTLDGPTDPWAGAGRSATVILCRTPGASACQSPNTTTSPERTTGLGAGWEQAVVAKASPIMAPAVAVSEEARRDDMGRSDPFR